MGCCVVVLTLLFVIVFRLRKDKGHVRIANMLKLAAVSVPFGVSPSSFARFSVAIDAVSVVIVDAYHCFRMAIRRVSALNSSPIRILECAGGDGLSSFG